MGILGLRKFIDGSACSRTISPAAEGEPCAKIDHVLLDMNCIVHSCYNKHQTSPKETIQSVFHRVMALLQTVASPKKTLTLCFDGPAPIAKLQTQRLRRRKLSHMDLANNTQFSDLAITAGSVFLVELELRLAALLQEQSTVPTFMFGSTDMGEGESKIASAMAYIATRHSLYRTNDTVAIFGNDIDLTLTCMGATQFHNLFVVGPSSLQVIAVGELLYRWMKSTTSFLTKVSQFPSTRVDFVFLFLLNGGDHFLGAGEVAMDLWKRYRLLRSSQPDRSIVSADLASIDTEFLSAVLQTGQYKGNADVEVGTRLLRAALWSLHTVVTGRCPDYQMTYEGLNPTLCNVKAALVAAGSKPISIRVKEHSTPLTPLATYVALMPTVETMPDSIRNSLLQQRKEALLKRLLESNEPKEIAQSATEAVECAAANLTPTQKLLCQFAKPVQINVKERRVEAPKRLSRHEQHRRMKNHEPLHVEPPPQPATKVVPIHIPDDFHYLETHYPVHELRFLNPFFSTGSGTTTTTAAAGGGGGSPSTSRNQTNGEGEPVVEVKTILVSKKRQRADDDFGDAADEDEIARFLEGETLAMVDRPLKKKIRRKE